MRIAVLLFYLIVATTARTEQTARAVVDEQERRHKVANETTVMEITLTDRKGFNEKRVLRRLDKDQGHGLMSSLTIFDAPADVKGTALLTRENEKKANDQWLYFPSQRRLHRIAQSRRNGYFMGTDFTYEDLDPECLDHYTYTHMLSDTIDGTDCFVIAVEPANKKIRRASGYSKRLLWIRKDIYFTIRIEFYDHKGTLIKTQINSQLKNLHDEVWRAQKSFVDNTKKQHQTEVIVIERNIESLLPDNTFTERHILTGRYMQ